MRARLATRCWRRSPSEHAEGIVRSAAKVFDQSRTQDDYLALAIIITDDSLAPAEELLRQACGFAQQEED